jgi:hypothetical protein
MTSIYIIPEASGDSNELEELAQKAGVPVLLVDKLYQLIERTADPILIARMRTNDVVTLMRNLNTLLPEIPSIIVNAPGSRQSTEFMSVTSTLPAVDWTEFSGKLAKSGLLAQTTSQAEERTVATQQGHKVENAEDSDELTDMSSFAARRAKLQGHNDKPEDLSDDIDVTSM